MCSCGILLLLILILLLPILLPCFRSHRRPSSPSLPLTDYDYDSNAAADASLPVWIIKTLAFTLSLPPATPPPNRALSLSLYLSVSLKYCLALLPHILVTLQPFQQQQHWIAGSFNGCCPQFEIKTVSKVNTTRTLPVEALLPPSHPTPCVEQRC